MTDSSPTSEQVYQVKEKLADLEGRLLATSPGLPTLLREIWVNLKKDADLVTILSPEECNILVRGLEKQTNVEMATVTIKSGTKGKALKNITLDDI